MAAKHLPQGRSFQPLSVLVLPEWNPRIIFDADFKTLVRSIKERPEFLLRRPILVADGPEHKAGGLVHGGNQRTRALEQLYGQGWEPPPRLQERGWLPGTYPVDVSDIPEAEAQAQALIDNNHGGQYQEDQLAEMVASLEQGGLDVGVLGFSEKRLEEILEASGIHGDEHQVEPPPDPPAKNGETNGMGAIKQISLYFQPDHFEAALALIEWVRKDMGVETVTEAVMMSLQEYRNEHDPVTSAT